MPNAGDIIKAGRIPGEVVASSSETSDSSTFTTTETVIGTLTFTRVSGVTYMIEAEAQVSSDTANDVVRILLREDNSTGTAIDHGVIEINSTADARPNTRNLRALHTAPASTSKTFVVTALRISGGSGVIRREASTTAPQLFTATVAQS